MFLKALLQTVLGMLIAAHALAFDEGIDYTQLAEPQATETGDKIEVLEVFMYSCPHCYHLEPDIDAWLKTKPENVEFRRMPAIFGPKVEPHARAFYAAAIVRADRQGMHPADVNFDGAINAVDLQLVVNGALGIDTGADCDVNHDGRVNAVDVQLAVNAVLGLW